MYASILRRLGMADSSGGWFSRAVDYTSLGCVLLGAEEGLRSLAIHLFGIPNFPALPWPAWLGALVIGYVLSFLGEKGPQMWHGLSGWIRNTVSSKGPLAEYPWEVFKVVVTIEDPVPESNTTITFKDKVRMDLTNVTGKEIHVWTPTWK